MATHSSILAWRIQWTEEERGVPNTVHGVTNSQTQLGDYHSLTYINIHVYRYIYIYSFKNILFCCGLLQDIDYASLGYTTGRCHVSTLYTVVCSR